MSVIKTVVATIFCFLISQLNPALAQTRYSGATDKQILASCPAFKSAAEIKLVPRDPDKGFEAFMSHMGVSGDSFINPRGDRCNCGHDRRDVKGTGCSPGKKSR